MPSEYNQTGQYYQSQLEETSMPLNESYYESHHGSFAQSLGTAVNTRIPDTKDPMILFADNTSIKVADGRWPAA